MPRGWGLSKGTSRHFVTARRAEEMGRVGFCKDTPILSSQRQPSGFSLGYEPRFGWAGEGHLPALPRACLLYIGALLRYNRVLSPPPKLYSSRQISSAPRLSKGKCSLVEPFCTRVCEGRKVTSTGSRSDQYWSRRRPVVVAIGHQYCFTQRPVLVTFHASRTRFLGCLFL